MFTNTSQDKLPIDYFVLVVILSIPFWIFGNSLLPLPMALPLSSLMVVCPLAAAAILCYRQGGMKRVKQLLGRAFDFKRIQKWAWYLPIIFLSPLIMFLSYVVMRLAGYQLPDAQIPWLMFPPFIVLFFLSGMGEEVGWMGYAIDPMQRRWGALTASIVMGLFWVIWHLIGDLQVGHPADWIFWHRMASVANRVIIVWLYNNTGKSVFGSILYHVMLNISWVAFPNYGSHYDPFVTGVITILTAVLVVAIWGPKTLSGYGLAGASRS